MKQIFRSKFRILLKNATEYTPQIIFSIVNIKYNLLYCGLHEEESSLYFVLQNKTKMSSNVLKKLLTDLDIEDIYPYENLTGTVIQSEGKFVKRFRRDNPVCPPSTVKYMLILDTVICSNAEEVYNQLSTKYPIHYCGFYEYDNSSCLYIHTKNRVSPVLLKKYVEKMGMYVEKISQCKKYLGTLVSGHGKLFKIETHIVRTSEAGSSTSKKQIMKPKDLGLSSGEELLIIGGKAYACREVNLLSSQCPQCTFGAVYGSIDGIWSVRFWIGPLENIGARDKKKVTESQKRELMVRQNSLCQECNCPVSIGSYSNSDIDHIVPRHLGGKTVLNNLQVICVPCHRTKTGLESKGVKRKFPDWEKEYSRDDENDKNTYVIPNIKSVGCDNKFDLHNGSLNPLEYIKQPFGMILMDGEPNNMRT